MEATSHEALLRLSIQHNATLTGRRPTRARQASATTLHACEAQTRDPGRERSVPIERGASSSCAERGSHAKEAFQRSSTWCARADTVERKSWTALTFERFRDKERTTSDVGRPAKHQHLWQAEHEVSRAATGHPSEEGASKLFSNERSRESKGTGNVRLTSFDSARERDREKRKTWKRLETKS